MTWNKKNLQFALSCGLRPSSEKLAHYLLNRSDKYQNTVVILDLREFNREIGKHRLKGKYDRKTIKEAIAQLNEQTYGWFKIVKTYTWAIHQVLVRPVESAISEKSQSLDKPPKLKRGNPMFSDAHKERLDKLLQQNISKLDSLLQKIGLTYNHASLKRIWAIVGQKFDEVERGIELMLYQNSVKPGSIVSPKAWLIGCLMGKWYQDFNPYYAPDLPIFDTGQSVVDFVGQISRDVHLSTA